MKILLISEKNNTKKVISYIKDGAVDVIEWDSLWYPYNLSEEALSEYDVVIIALTNEETARSVQKLVCSRNMNSAKIIDYYLALKCALPYENCKKQMHKGGEYEGVILGLSHAECGIIEERLDIPFVNLAVSSQDLFYNYKTLEFCLKNYPEQFKNLKYVVIDMFDYTYFNLDTSLNSMAVSYLWTFGGFIDDPHNFNQNKNFEFGYFDLCENIRMLRLEEQATSGYEYFTNIFDTQKLVNDICSKNRVFEEKKIQYRMNCIETGTDSEQAARFLSNGLMKTVHPDTIEDNIKIFDELINLIYSINSDMHIILMIMPQYIDEIINTEKIMAPWKENFYEILGMMYKKYPEIDLWDNKNCELSQNPYCFQDAEHLNYYGAMLYTDMLNNTLLS